MHKLLDTITLYSNNLKSNFSANFHHTKISLLTRKEETYDIEDEFDNEELGGTIEDNNEEWIVTMAFSLMASAFTFPFLLGLWWSRLTKEGGIAGMTRQLSRLHGRERVRLPLRREGPSRAVDHSLLGRSLVCNLHSAVVH